jgi:hypothetical protein
MEQVYVTPEYKKLTEHTEFLDSTSDSLRLGFRNVRFKNLFRFPFEWDRGSTVVKVLCYTSEGPLFDPNWRQWIFY